MTNRFDTPAQYNPIDTYVPLPLQQLMGAVQYKQAQGDAAEDAALRLSEKQMGSVLKSIDRPGFGRTDVSDISGAREADEKMKSYNQRLSDLMSRGVDPSGPMFRRELAGLGSEMRQFFAPEGLGGQAMQRDAEYKQLQAALARAEIGDKPWLAGPIRKELDRFIKEGGPINTGVSAVKPIDMAITGDKLMNNIAPMVKEVTYPSVDKNGNTVMISTGRKEVSEDKIRAAANGLLNSSDIGNELNLIEEHFTDLMKENDPNVTDKEAAAYGAQKRNERYKELEDGLVAKYKELSEKSGISIVGGKGSTTENPNFNLASVPDHIISNPNYKPDPRGINKDKEILDDLEKNRKNWKDGVPPTFGFNEWWNENKELVKEATLARGERWVEAEEKEKKLNWYKEGSFMANKWEGSIRNRMDSALNKFQEDFGISVSETDPVKKRKEQLDAYNQTMESLKSTTGSIVTFDEKKIIPTVNSFLGRTFAYQTIQDADNPTVFYALNTDKGQEQIEKQTGLSWEEFVSKMDILREGREKSGISVVGHPTNAQAGSMRINITGKNGQIKKINMTFTDDFKTAMQNPSTLGQAYARGLDSVEFAGGEGWIPIYMDSSTGKLEEARIKPGSSKNENTGKWEYDPILEIKDSSGKITVKRGLGVKSYIEQAYTKQLYMFAASGGFNR